MALPRSAWEQARERFLEGLEEPERLLFAEASLENIFYSASAAQKIHEENSRSRYLASKLNSLLAGVEQFGKALDVLSQASLVSSILWGSLRVVIHVSPFAIACEDTIGNPDRRRCHPSSRSTSLS